MGLSEGLFETGKGAETPRSLSAREPRGYCSRRAQRCWPVVERGDTRPEGGVAAQPVRMGGPFGTGATEHTKAINVWAGGIAFGE
jgi:hypothetical protein